MCQMHVVMSLNSVASCCCLSFERPNRQGTSTWVTVTVDGTRQEKEPGKESRLARQRSLIKLTERTHTSLAVSTYSETEEQNEEAIP